MLLLEILASSPLGLSAHRFSFARPIKEHVQQLFGFSNEQMTDPVLKNTPDPRRIGADGTPTSPRKAMQLYGTEFGRACEAHIWPRKLMEDIEGWRWDLPGSEVALVTDLRFENEYDVLRTNPNTLLIRMRRGVAEARFDTHASEAGIDKPFDLTLDNNGTIAELQARIVCEVLPRLLSEAEYEHFKRCHNV